MRKILFFALILLVLAGILEGIGRYLYKGGPEGVCVDCKSYEKHPALGWWHPPNSQHTAIKTCDDSPCYKATYKYDVFGRRSLPSIDRKGDTFIFVGGSWVFGEGLSTEETIPYLFQKKTGLRAFNYGRGGAGPSFLLNLLRSKKVQNEVKDEKSHLIFFMPEFLVTRVSPASNQPWLWDYPTYHNGENGLVFIENMEAFKPKLKKFYLNYGWLKEHSSFLKLMGRDFVYYDESERNQLMLDILMKARLEFGSLYGGKFYIATHPMNPLPKYVIDALKGKQFEILDLQQELPDAEFTVCDCDEHPNGKANQIVVDRLIKKLQLSSSNKVK